MRRRRGISRGAAVVFFVFALCAAGFPAGPDMTEYLEAPDEYGSVIPDFSHAGYMGGGVPLPDVPAVKELSPQPAGDDRERIQAALDAVSEMEPGEDGFRGAVLLRAGDYRVDGYLHIRESGVVLRGEGQFPGGTTITATRRDYVLPGRRRQHSLIYLGRHDTSRAGFLGKKNETVLTSETVPVGSREIRVRNTGGFMAGDDIIIEVYPNEAWLEALGGLAPGAWRGKATRAGTRFYYERQVAGIEGDRLYLDAPMTFYLDRNHLRMVLVWSYSDDGRISRSGVENLRLRSYYTDENYDDLENFTEYGADISHARSAVRVEPVRDCWVSNVTALHFPHAAVEVRAGARNVTVQDCAYIRPVSIIDGGRRYPFRVEGTRVLVQRCYAREARHAFASSSAGLGLNVFLDCAAEKNHADIGPHLKWAVGYLYDNIIAPQGRIEAILSGGGHGWRGANHVYWNCRTSRMVIDNPGTKDINWSIGSFAHNVAGRADERGRWVSHGTHVSPRSLYLYQLEERLGRKAVRNITIDLQRQDDAERIFDYLKGKYAELTDWERANDGNLIRDPGFRILTVRNPWMLRDSDEPVLRLERAVNPVFGDDTALVIPAGDELRYRYERITEYPSARPREYELRFDYKLERGAMIRPRVYHYITPPEGWQMTGQFDGPREQGGGDWENYSFRFTLEPVLDEISGMPHQELVHMRFETEGELSIANPFIEEINPL